MNRRGTGALALAAALLLPAVVRAEDTTETEAPALPSVADDHPVYLDRTGIEWVLPFERAQAAAKASGHPLLIKAVAFGTTKSGCW